MSSRRMNDIEVLSEQLGSLQITEEASSNYEQTDTEMSVALAPAAVSKNIQVGMLKNMIPDLGQFDSNQTKFKDWQRGMQLFLKSNRVMETNDRIIAILACLREGVVGIYTQKKLDELDEELEIQNQDDFMKEIKTIFGDKIKAADAKQRIESFKQGKWNTVDFMIEFNILAMKADMDGLHVIFLLKKNV